MMNLWFAQVKKFGPRSRRSRPSTKRPSIRPTTSSSRAWTPRSRARRRSGSACGRRARTTSICSVFRSMSRSGSRPTPRASWVGGEGGAVPALDGQRRALGALPHGWARRGQGPSRQGGAVAGRDGWGGTRRGRLERLRRGAPGYGTAPRVARGRDEPGSAQRQLEPPPATADG